MLDLVLYNGIVLTDATAAPASAIAIREGRIVFVGADREALAASGRPTERIDLGGRTVVPGFNDAYAHIWKIGQLLTSLLDVRRIASIDELVQAVKRWAEGVP